MPNKNIPSEAILFFTISVLFFISITSFDPFVSSYASELGIPPVMIGSIVGITGLASMFTRLPLGVLSDILLKRKLFIQAGLIITMVSWSIAYINPNEYTLFIGKLSNGLTGSTWVIYTVMFTGFFHVVHSAKAIAIISVASPLGSFLGSTIGGLVINQFDYAASFLVAVLSALLAFLLTIFIREVAVNNESPKYNKSIFTKQIMDKSLWIISILGIITQMVMYGTRDSFTPLLAKNLGATPIIISWLSNTHLILFGISTALCPLFYKKVGLKNTGILGFTLQGIMVILLPFAPNLPVMFILQAIAGIAYGLNFTFLMSIILENATLQEKTTRMGFFQSFYSIGVFCGPLLMGLFIEAFSEVVGYTFIGLASVVAALLTKFLIYDKVLSKEEKLRFSSLEDTWRR